MKNCTDEQLARALFLTLLEQTQGRALREDVLMAKAEEYGLAGSFPAAAHGLGITKFQHGGECYWQLPPNVVGFFRRDRHAHRFTGSARGGSAA